MRLHLKKDPLVAVTIFTIEMLPHNRTLYKLCGRYNYTNRVRQPKEIPTSIFVTDTENTMTAEAEDDSDDLVVDVHCDGQDAVGHYIFIRDDRKKEDYFSICDVEVFQFDRRGQSVLRDNLPSLLSKISYNREAKRRFQSKIFNTLIICPDLTF